MNIEVKCITPEMAKSMLECNLENNRNISKAQVDRYARDMANGKWKLTGETIKFDTLGRLIDGQHRLAAIIKANVPVMQCIATDVDPSSLLVVDSGMIRNTSAIMKICGKESIYYDSTALALVKLIAIVVDKIPPSTKLSPQEVEPLVTKYLHLCRFAKAHKGHGRLGNASYFLALFATMSCGYPKKKIKAFMECVNTGAVDPFIQGVNWQAAIKFRREYDSGSLTPNNFQYLYRATKVYEATTTAIYCFCNNVKKRLNPVSVPITEEGLLELNEHFSKFELFKEDWTTESIWMGAIR